MASLKLLALIGESQVKPMFEFFGSKLGQLRAKPLGLIHVFRARLPRRGFREPPDIRVRGQELLGVLRTCRNLSSADPG